MGRHKAKIEREPIKIELPDADVFLEKLEEYIEKVNDISLGIISERLGITRTQAEELAKRVQDEAEVKYIEEQAKKDFIFLGFLGKPYK